MNRTYLRVLVCLLALNASLAPIGGCPSPDPTEATQANPTGRTEPGAADQADSGSAADATEADTAAADPGHDPGPVPSNMPEQIARFEAFEASDHDYCDAKMLAAIWTNDIADSKLMIGQKLIAGDTEGLQSALTRARQNAVTNREHACAFHETEFSYEDAEVLAGAWQISVTEAKTTIEDKVIHGGTPFAREAVAYARQTNPTPTDSGDPDQAFFASQYDYCDAKMLAAVWTNDVSEAKTMIGQKLIAGDEAGLELALGRARENARANRQHACAFHETPFSYEDAEVYASLWNLSVTEAKTAIEDKVIDGTKGIARQQIEEARGQHGGGEGGQATAAEGYCDAKMLASVWEVDVAEASRRVGLARAGNAEWAQGVAQDLPAARENARTNPEHACSFHEAGFTYEDAEALAALWEISTDEAKAAIEKKVLDEGFSFARDAVAGARAANQPGH